jgi:hypothetical protein
VEKNAWFSHIFTMIFVAKFFYDFMILASKLLHAIIVPLFSNNLLFLKNEKKSFSSPYFRALFYVFTSARSVITPKNSRNNPRYPKKESLLCLGQ